MSKQIWALLACFCAEASASFPSFGDGPLGQLMDHVAFEELPQAALEAAGFPTEKQLVCKAMNNSKIQAKVKHMVCQWIPEKWREQCESAVDFSWRQEKAEEKCPGAPEPWWPYHVLHELANKLICQELSKGSFHDKEKAVTKDVCEEISENSLEKWGCVEALDQLWKHYETDCKTAPLPESVVPKELTDMLPENVLPENALPENKADAADIHV